MTRVTSTPTGTPQATITHYAKDAAMKMTAMLFTITALSTASTAITEVSAQSIGTSVPVTVLRGDANGDGTIDATDQRTMLDVLFGTGQRNVCARNLDANGDGQFDLADAETVSAIVAAASEPPDLQGDLDGDGTITMSDLKLMLAILFDQHPSPVSDRQLDQNGDGNINIMDAIALNDLVNAAPETRKQQAEPESRETRAEQEWAIVGDVSDDGQVDIADMISLLEYLTGGARYPAPSEAADVNGDGQVNVADLAVLGDSIL